MLASPLAVDQCAAEIMTIVPSMTRFLRAQIRRHGQPHLSLSQLRVLHFLNRKPQASLTEVADYLDVTRPTMSVMVERLVQRGLIHRVEDPAERRRLSLSLTEAGAAEMERVSAATLTSVARQLEGLSEEELQKAIAGLTILQGIFSEH